MNTNNYRYETDEDWEEEPIYVQTVPARSKQYEDEAFWEEMLRKGEYLATAAEQGLSYGWADEMEGAMAGLGYGLGSLNPHWNTRGESFKEAMRRGYVEARDRRRRKLEEAYREMPVAAAAVEIGSSLLAPGIKKVPKYSFFKLHDKARRTNTVVAGALYGAGSSDEGGNNLMFRTALGGFGGLAGHHLGNTILNRYTPYPVRRAGVNWLVSKGGEHMASPYIDEED